MQALIRSTSHLKSGISYFISSSLSTALTSIKMYFSYINYICRISYLKNYVQFRVKTESSFSFLQNTVVFLYSRGYTTGDSFPYNLRHCCQRFAGFKGLNIYFERKREKFFSELVRVTAPTTRL